MASQIAKLAFQSRLAVIALQCVGNILIPDHDAGVFSPPVTDEEQFTIADKIVMFFLSGFRRWDAIYFLHIAQHGYTYENCVAFFPLYPMIISTVKSVAAFCPYLSETSLLLLSGVLMNVTLFVVTAVILLQLGQRVMHNVHLSYLAAVLFCINPASIFMTAPYTETLFACLSFGGMLLIRQKKVLAGTILIGASALTRSNGLVSLGFIFHYLAADHIHFIISTYKVHKKTVSTFIVRVMQRTVIIALKTIVYLLISLIPFLSYQLYIYKLFCFPDHQNTETLDPAVINYGHQEGFKLIGEGTASPWCFDSLPLSYTYIQSHHWQVGFMKYYQVKQIPNFILAAPIVALSLCACYSFYLQRPDVCRTLGLVEMEKYKVETVGSYVEKKEDGWHSAHLVVYILHLLFLTCFGCFFMHIQVLTRFLCSASPVIFWFAACTLCEQNELETASVDPDSHPDYRSLLDLLTLFKCCSSQGRYVLLYFWGYFVIGTLAFSNFLPWT